MPDRNPKINRLLIFITVFLCLICGLLFTQSSAGPFGNNYNSVVTGNTDDISVMASNSGHNSTSSSTEVSATPSITPSPAPSKVPENGNVSPEAENGIWTADGSDWKFLVNGEAYTGWLIISTKMVSCSVAGSSSTKNAIIWTKMEFFKRAPLPLTVRNTPLPQMVPSKNDISLYRNIKKCRFQKEPAFLLPLLL